MKFAIILPLFNAELTILRAVNSVLSQTHEDFTLYVINDGSTDNSVDIIKENINDTRLILIENEMNLGVSETRNRGIDASVEDYICFIDSDDEWEVNKLELQCSAINRGAEAIITAYNYINENGACPITHAFDELNFDDFLNKKYRVCFSSLCVKRDPSLRFEKRGHEDFKFIIDVYKIYKKVFFINCALVNYYSTSGSLSSNKLKAARWHWDIIKDNYGVNIKSIKLFLFYFYQGIKFSIMVKKKT